MTRIGSILPFLLFTGIAAEICVTSFVLVPETASPFQCDGIKASGIRTAAQACLATSCNQVASYVGFSSAECLTTSDGASGLLFRGGFVQAGGYDASSIEQCIHLTLESTRCLQVLQRVNADLTGMKYVSTLQQQTLTPAQTPPPVVVPSIDFTPSTNTTSTTNASTTENSTWTSNSISPSNSTSEKIVFPTANSNEHTQGTPSAEPPKENTNYSSTASSNNDTAKGAVIGLTVVIVLLLGYAIGVTYQRRRTRNEKSKATATENKASETSSENDGDTAEVWTCTGLHNQDNFRPFPTVQETTEVAKNQNNKRLRDLFSSARNYVVSSKSVSTPTANDNSSVSGSNNRSPAILNTRASEFSESNLYCETEVSGKDEQSLCWSSAFEVSEIEDIESSHYEYENAGSEYDLDKTLWNPEDKSESDHELEDRGNDGVEDLEGAGGDYGDQGHEIGDGEVGVDDDESYHLTYASAMRSF